MERSKNTYRQFLDCKTSGNDTVNEYGKPQATANTRKIDGAILQKLRKGDHKSFEIVFNMYYGRVKSFSSFLTKDKDTGEEIAQKVFVDLWEKRERIDPNNNFNAYIYTITRNTTINAIKSMNRTVQGEFESWDVCDGNYTDDHLIARETELLIKLAVDRMPEKRRIVYELSRYQNKSNDEISNELKISKKVVEKHLRFALAEIRQTLKIFVAILFC